MPADDIRPGTVALAAGSVAPLAAMTQTQSRGAPPEGRPSRLQRLLLAWYRNDARSLPWRRTPDPYCILVSEVMLQQTQAARVEPVYAAFVARFPTVDDLAAAPLDDVVTQWAGLGYNRRAVSLHRAARTIVERHGGRVPADLDALRALDGVGDYTARAVLAFAYGHEVAPVDVNVARVLARAAAGHPQTRRQAQSLAESLLPSGRAAEWGQSLMDLGARYCTARAPRCEACPVAAACSWRLARADDPDGATDPAATTAARARPQGVFAGSNRFHRGQLVDALRRGPVACDEVAAAAGCDDGPRVAAITRDLVDDGLAEWSDGMLRLPH